MQATTRRIREQLDLWHFAGSAAFVLAVTLLGTSLSVRSRARDRATGYASARDVSAEHRARESAQSVRVHSPPSRAASARATASPQRAASSAGALNVRARAAARPIQRAGTQTNAPSATAVPAPALSPSSSPESTAAARALLDHQLAPFGLEHAVSNVHGICVAAHGIWSDGAGPTCQLPGGRRFRFAVSAGRLSSITLEQVGLAPVPLLPDPTVQTLNTLTTATRGALIVSASARHLSVSVTTSNAAGPL